MKRRRQWWRIPGVGLGADGSGCGGVPAVRGRGPYGHLGAQPEILVLSRTRRLNLAFFAFTGLRRRIITRLATSTSTCSLAKARFGSAAQKVADPFRLGSFCISGAAPSTPCPDISRSRWCSWQLTHRGVIPKTLSSLIPKTARRKALSADCTAADRKD